LFKIYEQIKNNPASAEEQNLKFLLKVVNKTATSAAQFAKCIMLYAYSHTTAIALSCATRNKNFIQPGITVFLVIN